MVSTCVGFKGGREKNDRQINRFSGNKFANTEKNATFVVREVIQAQMAELVDALVSNTSGAIRAGSIPALGTF